MYGILFFSIYLFYLNSSTFIFIDLQNVFFGNGALKGFMISVRNGDSWRKYL